MRHTLYVLIAFLLVGCGKDEVRTIEEPKDVFIPDNVPPPDYTVDSSTLEIYVHKVYVNALGREPINNEKADAMAALKAHNFSADDRKQFLQSVFSKGDYKRNLYTIACIEYLNNMDSMDVEEQIYLYELLLTQPQYAPFYDALNTEVGRLKNLRNIPKDLDAGTLTHQGMLKRCVDNYFYDQINMGTENFVVSTYQNFLFRYPTQAEVILASNMVNGSSSQIFLQVGKTKQDYIDIFFASDDYYEGQVRFVFRKYLFREPSSAEMTYYANVYKTSGSYSNMQMVVFSTNEYAGVVK